MVGFMVALENIVLIKILRLFPPIVPEQAPKSLLKGCPTDHIHDIRKYFSLERAL